MKPERILLFILFFLFLAVSLSNLGFSQHNNFQTFSIDKGLPHSNVYCLIQDSRGYLWAGTEGGLTRFDGFSFKVYGKKDGLSGNMIRALLEDSRGNIWIGTDEGISVYNGVFFRNITGENGLSGKVTITLLEDYAKNIWAGTDDGGVNRINLISQDTFVIKNFSEENGLSNNTVFDIFQDKEKRLWIATFGGLNIFTPDKDSFQISVLRGGLDIPSDMILAIKEDSKGNMWVGTGDAGAFKIAKSKDGKVGEVFRYNIFNGFPANRVWDILSDKNGDLWFGTSENGLVRLKPDSPGNSFETYDVQNGLPNNMVMCLLQDNEGNLWMGTNGGGMCKLIGDHFSHYSEKDGLSNNLVRAIVQDKEENYWFGTDGGGLTKMHFKGNVPLCESFTTRQGLPSDLISSVSMGKHTNNYLWIGTTDRGIAKYDGKTFVAFNENNGLASDRVNCVFVDSKGFVWCGTAGGISKYDGVEFISFSTEGMMMNDQGVKTIIEDKKGNIWFGTAGGLARYANAGKLRTFDEVEGLKDKDVNTIAEAPNGNIWIGTNGGGIYMLDTTKNDTNAISFIADEKTIFSNIIVSLAFLSEKTLIAGTYKGFIKITISDGKRVVSVKNYSASDGFFGMECNDNAIYKDKDDYLWIGTSKGVTRYAPLLEKTNPSPPQTHITSIKLFFKNVDWKTKSDSIIPWFELPTALILPYSENHFTFEFTGITFTNPEKVLYSYKLDGLENDWSPLQKDNKVTYSGLAPGEYTFGVIAVNENRKLAQPATFKFTINPPWWQTWWFYTLCGITIIGLVISYIKIRERKLKEEKAILEQKVVERTAEVVKQKEEIELKNANLENANSEIMHQKEIIEEKNKDITDSITYAQGIQKAILPPDEKIKKYLPDSFILFRPRDIVSGDFYWMEVAPLNPPEGLKPNTQVGGDVQSKLPTSGGEEASLVLFAACDCTGHGVPGGFVSMVGSNGLTRTVNEHGIIHPARILDEAALMVEETFSVGKRKDGMDVVLCGLCTQKGKKIELEFSAANNPLYIVRKKENGFLTENGQAVKVEVESETHNLFQINADKQPVGAYEYRKPFTNHLFELLPGDTIYLSTDGYRDQFGGQKGKKFMAKNMKQILVSFQDKTMEEQKEFLDKTIGDWMSGYGQNDDICVIGVRV